MSWTQEIGSTIGVPVLSAIAASRSSLLTGIHFAVAVSVAVIVSAVALIWTGLRRAA